MDERLTLTRDGSDLHAAGEVDAATAPELDAGLAEAVEAGGDVRLDLSGIGFIDSLGLRVLVRVHRQLADADRRLVLVAPSATVERALDYAGLAEHLHVEGRDSQDDDTQDGDTQDGDTNDGDAVAGNGPEDAA